MKKLLLTGAMLASACSGKGEIIPTPSPEPHTPTTLQPINSTVLEAPTTTIPATTTTEPEPEPTTIPTVPPRRSSTSTPGYLREEATSRSSSSQLASIRACESGGNYSTDTGNGYYGAYQFSWGTWQSVGGSGNPAHASPAEQDMRAQMMLDQGRRGEWPNC